MVSLAKSLKKGTHSRDITALCREQVYDATQRVAKAAEAGRPVAMVTCNYRLAVFGFLGQYRSGEIKSVRAGFLVPVAHLLVQVRPRGCIARADKEATPLQPQKCVSQPKSNPSAATKMREPANPDFLWWGLAATHWVLNGYAYGPP